MTTTIEHRRIATLAILVSADGPLTGSQVRGRLVALGHSCAYHDAGALLRSLVRRGLADTRCDTLAGARSRIFWPTPDGRALSTSVEDSRIEGV